MSDEIAQVSTCWCEKCRPITLEDMRMVLCPECGNKRCPRATNHIYQCTGSNEPGQPGSSYPARHEEMARLREDAARYRWLRSQTKISDSRFYDLPKISSLNFTGTGRDYNSKFDACLDNTRKAKT